MPEDLLQSLQLIALPDPDELLGLYVGRSIQGRSFFDAGGELPDRVYIYRGPILERVERRRT